MQHCRHEEHRVSEVPIQEESSKRVEVQANEKGAQGVRRRGAIKEVTSEELE